MDMLKALRRICGERILKTGISVFITAFICLSLNLPVLFAVITAIVTIEPTTSDSIKKAMVRFPASALGAAIALSLTAVYGESALTYSLSAALTILLCSKFNWEDGILVATLTAIAMIPSTSDHFLIAFFSRLGTTSIGIIISTLVNLFIFPPNYSPRISETINELYKQAGTVLEKTIEPLFSPKSKDEKLARMEYKEFTKKIDKTFQLCEFQRSEFKFHKAKTKDVRQFYYSQKELHFLQQLAFHLGNLQYVNISLHELPRKKKEVLVNTVKSIIEILNREDHHIPSTHFQLIEQLIEQFKEWEAQIHHHPAVKYHHHFEPLTILLYELLSLHDVLEELEGVSRKEEQKITVSI